MSERKTEWVPKGARMIVKRVDEMEGNIILAPTSTKNSSMIVEIVTLGTRLDADYQVGEKLLIGRYSGYDVPVFDRSYTDCLIVNEDDILCFDGATLMENINE